MHRDTLPSQTTARVLSITEFCHRYGISRSGFYTLQKNGAGPRIIVLGRRRLITTEAAEQWLGELEASSAR